MKDWRYILYVAGAIVLFLIVKLTSPKQYDWTVSLEHDNKDPFGAYALHALLPSQFKSVRLTTSNQTFYEFKDSLQKKETVFILASNFSGDKEDTEALLDYVGKGATAFISAQYFWGKFADTLNVSTSDYFFADANAMQAGKTYSASDSSSLRFANHALDSTRTYFFKRDNIHNYFETFDTTRTTIIAWNDRHKPVSLKVQWGDGHFILNSTPIAFTNIYLMRSEHLAEFAGKMLSYLPERNVYWTEFYQVGRRESATPLRFVLTNEPLRWAYYLTLGAILLFMIFEAKRKQRIIPVIKPLANTTLEFVSTIGNLYFQKGDHKDIAEKKIQFLMEQIRAKYWLHTTRIDDVFLTSLASKAGKSLEEVMILFKTIKTISSQPSVSAEQLMDLNQKIEKFHES
jgi:hypothetical protein